MNTLDTFFIITGLFILIQSLLALGASLRFSNYSLRPQSSRQTRYQPKAVIIVPCKGFEHGFEENIRALFVQEYRDYELIFVTESEADPAYGALTKLIKQTRRAAWLVVAGEARGRGQKVHNLCAAIEMLNSIDRRAEVLVFADSDARVARHWLGELIAPLGDKRIGATTGFRWHLPDQPASGGAGKIMKKRGGRLASILLSVWNSSALSLLGERSRFAWGGSTAIRRENFDKLGIKHRWQGALSDDYSLTSAIVEAGQRIKFIPHCLVASFTTADSKEMLEFTSRQMSITRIYSPVVWKTAAFSHTLFNLGFWGGLIWFATGLIKGQANLALGLMLAGVFGLGAVSGFLRAFVAAKLLHSHREQVQRLWWAYILLGPVASLIYFYNILASTRSRRVVWRGIGYEMLSPNETIIWHRPAPRSPFDSISRTSRKRKASVRSSSQK